MKQAPPIRNDQCTRTLVVDDNGKAAGLWCNTKSAACWKTFTSSDRGFKGHSGLADRWVRAALCVQQRDRNAELSLGRSACMTHDVEMNLQQVALQVDAFNGKAPVIRTLGLAKLIDAGWAYGGYREQRSKIEGQRSQRTDHTRPHRLVPKSQVRQAEQCCK